jgi:hypothetical protein
MANMALPQDISYISEVKSKMVQLRAVGMQQPLSADQRSQLDH